MEAFATKRLWVSPDTDEEIPYTFNIGSTEGMDQFLESLTQEQLDTLRSDIPALRDLIGRMSAFSDAVDRQVFIARDFNGTVVGYIGVNYSRSQAPELQIQIAKEYQHQGYGTELLGGFLHHWKYLIGFECFVYHVRSQNDASIRLVEKMDGILQPPKNKAEEILLRTYYIEKHGGKRICVRS